MWRALEVWRRMFFDPTRLRLLSEHAGRIECKRTGGSDGFSASMSRRRRRRRRQPQDPATCIVAGRRQVEKLRRGWTCVALPLIDSDSGNDQRWINKTPPMRMKPRVDQGSHEEGERERERSEVCGFRRRWTAGAANGSRREPTFFLFPPHCVPMSACSARFRRAGGPTCCHGLLLEKKKGRETLWGLARRGS
ncbi:hypothetical protein LZ30DRAFT_422445 [Colletotrichum cereale]|nr:hypothetical protein LZ30DRAFT_422445 [Colletotrichum cereale]